MLLNLGLMTKIKKSKIKYGDKKTFIDEISCIPKERRGPGPGAYNLFKTDKQVEDEKKKMKSRKQGGADRLNFLCEMEYLSNTIPGPGNYNPRHLLPKIHENKMKPEDWKKKTLQKCKEYQNYNRYQDFRASTPCDI